MRNALQPQNLPTPVEEKWKYTNLPRAVPQGLSPVAKDEKVIHIKRGEKQTKPIEILWAGLDNTLHTPVLKITLEEGAEATIIERHEGTGAYWKNMVTEIVVGANARLNHVCVQNDTMEAVQTNLVTVTTCRDAVFDGFRLNMGGKLTRHDLHAIVDGTNAECTFNGINLLAGQQHGDTTILIEHKAPHCRSNQFYRTILDDAARGVFQGKVHVHKPAQKTDAYQLSNAILLSDKAEMDTKPELEIYADDVKCSHGATTGQLDEGPLFYLRSRGLSDKEARLMLIQAFIDEVTDKIADESLRAEIQEKATAWLHAAL
jgi:Fe-S cluster assembly protein SufD